LYPSLGCFCLLAPVESPSRHGGSSCARVLVLGPVVLPHGTPGYCSPWCLRVGGPAVLQSPNTMHQGAQHQSSHITPDTTLNSQQHWCQPQDAPLYLYVDGKRAERLKRKTASSRFWNWKLWSTADFLLTAAGWPLHLAGFTPPLGQTGVERAAPNTGSGLPE